MKSLRNFVGGHIQPWVRAAIGRGEVLLPRTALSEMGQSYDTNQ